MVFKDILSRALESLLFCGAEPFVQFLVEDIKSNNSVKLFKFGPVVQEQMLFIDISYLELWWPFCSAKRNNMCLCNFGRGYPEEQFCEISSNLDQSFRRSCHLKQKFYGQTALARQRQITIAYLEPLAHLS